MPSVDVVPELSLRGGLGRSWVRGCRPAGAGGALLGVSGRPGLVLGCVLGLLASLVVVPGLAVVQQAPEEHDQGLLLGAVGGHAPERAPELAAAVVGLGGGPAAVGPGVALGVRGELADVLGAVQAGGGVRGGLHEREAGTVDAMVSPNPDPSKVPSTSMRIPDRHTELIAQAVGNLLAAGYRILRPDDLDLLTLDRIMDSAARGGPAATETVRAMIDGLLVERKSRADRPDTTPATV